MLHPTSMAPHDNGLNDLLGCLQRLDILIAHAVEAASADSGPDPVSDPFRGLYIDREDVQQLISRAPGLPSLCDEEWAEARSVFKCSQTTSRFGSLMNAFGLTLFDLDVMLIALAPELDLRYERIYAFLQDDITRKRPTVDLALNLLCATSEEKLTARIHFSADAPLLHLHLLHLIPDPNQVRPPLLAQYLKLDEQIIRYLLNQPGLDSRLADSCHILQPTECRSDDPAHPKLRQAVSTYLHEALQDQTPVKLHFFGPKGVGKRRVAECLARDIGAPLIVANMRRLPTESRDFELSLRLLFREAWFYDAILLLDGLDVLSQELEATRYQSLAELLAASRGMTILTSTKPGTMPQNGGPSSVVSVPFPTIDFAERKRQWKTHLGGVGVILTDQDLSKLGDRFRLTSNQIAAAASHAIDQAYLEGLHNRDGHHSSDRGPDVKQLFAAARGLSDSSLAMLARRLQSRYAWDDLVLPDDITIQLHELCSWVACRRQVLDEWGFERKLSHGKGINALFVGLPGTGKTMAAEVISSELDLDLYKIDLSTVVSKYVGETEKNLARIFSAAENTNAILVFDEADALFGKRTEVKDAHDRYANIEVSYLLQRMEDYEGVTILTTNLRANMDSAFVRRMAFILYFPLPDAADRLRIWVRVWPPETPLSADLDLDLLAHQFEITGGNIKNAALAAAFLAAAEGSSVGMEHVLQAMRREYQKMGKTMVETEPTGAVIGGGE